jgi:hypothetical protein
MWRACRLVVDTGIHAFGWSRDQARAYLRDLTALSEHEIETEVDRYIAWPGQALAYKVGELAILELRARAEHPLGARVDIRRFHDALLELGSVPLPVLEARIDRFIAEDAFDPPRSGMTPPICCGSEDLTQGSQRKAAEVTQRDRGFGPVETSWFQIAARFAH